MASKKLKNKKPVKAAKKTEVKKHKKPVKKIATKVAKKPAKAQKKVAVKKTKKPAVKKLKAKNTKKVVKKITAKKEVKKLKKEKLAKTKAPALKKDTSKTSAKIISKAKNSIKEKAAEAEKAIVVDKKPEPQKAPLVVKKSNDQKVNFKINEHAVYPSHGVGKIIDIERTSVLGHDLSCYLMYFEKEKLTIKIPTNSAEKIGLRHLASKSQMDEVFSILRSGIKKLKGMWSRRAQEYETKINSGDIILLAEVLRDLTRDIEDGERSYSERIIYETAVHRLAAEYAIIYGIDFEEAKEKVISTAKDKLGTEGKITQKDEFDEFDYDSEDSDEEEEDEDSEDEDEEEDDDDFDDYDDEDEKPKRKSRK